MNPQKLMKILQEALALHQAGRLDEAAVIYAKIRAAAPKNFDAANLAGTLQIQQGNFADAARTLAVARRLAPRSAVCAMRLGVALNALGRFSEAAEALGAAVALDEALPEGWFHLGRSLEQLGRVDEAVASVQRALSVRPDYAEAHDCLGAMLTQSHGHGAAEPHLRRATELEPNFARAWCNLGICLVYLGRLGEALTCFDRTLVLDPQLHHAYAGRGLALERAHRISEAVADYGRALVGNPLNHQARSARLMAMHYLSGISAETMRMEHVRFGELAEADLKPSAPVVFLPRTDSGGRLRVGFLSPNLRAHSVAHFLEPILEHLDQTRFEVYLYHDHPSVDATSARLRHHAAQWRQVAGVPNEALEIILREDRLDILVDLAGHTELNRMALLARRMAPVQTTYLGYPDTTGLRSMDYRLVDEVTDPLGESEEFCSERLIRFAPTAWCYAPPVGVPEPMPGPAAHGEAITFGCFNNFAKVTDETMRAWGRILATVPGSRLLLKGFGLGGGALQSEAQRRLAAAGIDPARLDLLDRTRSQADHLAAYARVDISLDTYPYHGTTTTCEALWMGVPVVTLAGDRHASRVGVSLLRAVGHGDWVARDWDDYVAVAGVLAADPVRLASWRTGLRDDFRHSALFDHAGQAAKFGAALGEMWRVRPAEGSQAERRTA